MDCTWDDALLQQGDALPPELLHIIRDGSSERYLQALTQASLDPRYTYTLFAHCEKLFPHICASLRLQGSLASTVATLGRIIPFAPYLIPYAERLLDNESYTFSGGDDDLQYLLGIFRLFSFEPRTFMRFARPNEISTLLLQSKRRPLVYLAIRILQIYLSCADDWFEQMVEQYLGEDTPEDDINGQWDDISIDYRFLTLWEEQRFERVQKLVKDATSRINSAGAARRVLSQDSFDSSTTLVGQILLPRSRTKRHTMSTPQIELAHTRTTISNLNSVATAVKLSQPVLLTGLAGSGKTSLARSAAQKIGTLDQMITLHLNEQSDAKLLIGIHSTGDTPGTFVWKPGVLTTAVQEGRWILIEDLDRAPNEILGTLLPLIEKRELLIPSRKQTIHAPPGFRIIATVRSSIDHRGEEAVPLSQMLGARHWQRVHIKTPPTTEIQEILLQLFPTLSALAAQLIAVYERLRAFGQRAAFSGRWRSVVTRAISVRDLLKWCKRVEKTVHLRKSFSSTDMDNIFMEAVDCFIGALPDGIDRTETTAIVAEELRIDPQRRDYLINERDVRYEVDKGKIRVGRYTLPRTTLSKKVSTKQTTFSTNPHTTKMLERVAAAVTNAEPLLLVGETGVGKTTAVQHLADSLDKKLVAFNLSQQSEAGDLLGGIKPVSMRSLVMPMKSEFDELFAASFSMSKNQQFLSLLAKQMSKSSWRGVCKMWQQALSMVEQQRPPPNSTSGEAPTKKRKIESKNIDFVRWEAFATKVAELEQRLKANGEALAFTFVEGNIVKAVRNGDWVLLDEINLASTDTLESIADLFDADKPSVLLTESGNAERVEAHADFRIFAAMNPATDTGKKDLPPGIRSRFSELYVESPDKDIKSLQSIVRSYLRHESAADPAVSLDVSALYHEIIALANQNKLVDGAGQKPHFSLRTLTRTLSFAKFTTPLCSLRRALYEGFQMSFLTFLDHESAALVQRLVESRLFGKTTNVRAELQKSLRKPTDHNQYVQGFPGSKHWVRIGDYKIEEQPHYILTPFIRSNLENLVRATSTRQSPVLIQGPTSSGKTSMIEYLAKRSGHQFVRINNHEHTDLQEYLGTYVSGPDGRLQFEEGILVKALRCGHWLVLDELNLAPTDVLEALNRLLDDNRELSVPETQEIVRPHENFMLFATQNPAGLYGGRKALSRAFRNRFLELHFADIPIDELQEILQRRTELPESRCKRIVAVYRELSVLRQENRLFEQKSFATLRDLFRWAFRPNDTIEKLASNGFMLLAERVRKPEERQTLKGIIEKAMSANGPRVSINETALYSHSCSEVAHYNSVRNDEDVVWTQAMRRLYVLVSRAIHNNEPVLLVGDTGCGKTTVCQILAHAFGQPLHTVNAHQSTEAGDLIGSQRPVRNRAIIEASLRHQLLSSPLLESLDTASAHSIDVLLDVYDRAAASLKPSEHTNYLQSTAHKELQTTRTRFKALFEWVDGGLVNAMKSGSFFLLDEISLADDAVLERINSVLEPQRSILLAEKGSIDAQVFAQPGFQFFATMNPGGDYGKRELSPALRNRFTEIWVPPLNDTEDIVEIVSSRLVAEAKRYANALVAFALWFKNRYNTSATSSISIRDVLTWVDFVNAFSPHGLETALVHGAAMVYVDTLGANPAGLMTITRSNVDQERLQCLEQLTKILDLDANTVYFNPIEIANFSDRFTAGPFSIPTKLPAVPLEQHFSFKAPTTGQNTMRVVRALLLRKPVMLEGSPGVGKTALVTAIAQAVSMPLTRINLSEQTDLLDLFGSDVPVSGEETDLFVWRDAPFLRAMKNGEWILLDEMNLASQSVLEGLNACLDHRGEVFIPELGQTFVRHPEFRLFAAQNPHHQGGGRKGLPASFVNRFTVVFTDAFRSEDLALVSQQKFPDLDCSTIKSAIQFVDQLEYKVNHLKQFGTQGGPWEFNLRDLTRWLSLTSGGRLLASGTALDFVDFLFVQRFRSGRDETFVRHIFSQCFQDSHHTSDALPSISRKVLQLGLGLLPRSSATSRPLKLMPPRVNSTGVDLRIVQSVMLCVQRSWPAIISGPSGSGKTDLIGRLASIVGASVVSISMNAETDAMDLIGGYEQSDNHRERMKLLDALREGLRSRARRHLPEPHQSMIQETLVALDKLNATSVDVTAIAIALEGIEDPDLQAILHRLRSGADPINGAKFEWVDGLLIEALQEGKWLILDNANLSSPSVLDRLNSLLEPEGVLVVSEHASQDGTPKVIRPHPSFRIFLVADPRYGELSRAMRNRCVELYLPGCNDRALSASSGSLEAESTIVRYRYAKALSSKLQQDNCSTEVVEVLGDHVGMCDSRLLSRFVRQLDAGLYGDVLKTSSSALSRPSSTWLRIKQARPLETFYQACISNLQVPSDFTDVQTLHPLNNEALIHCSEQVLSNARSLALNYDAGVQFISIQNRLADITANAALISKLRRTERSLLSKASQRDPLPNSSITVGLLERMANGALESLQKIEGLSASSARAARQVLGRVSAFCVVFLAHTQNGSLDVPSLVSFALTGRRIATWSINNASAAPATYLSGMLEELASLILTACGNRGRAYSALWDALKMPLPATEEQLGSILAFETMMDHFDLVSRKLDLPIQTTVDLRILALRNLDLARYYGHDLTLLSGKLREVISNVRDGDYGHVDHTPHFHRDFAWLCEHFIILALEGRSLMPEQFATLELMAMRSSRHSVNLSPTSSQTSVQRLLRLLGSCVGESIEPLDPDNADSSHEHLLRNLASTDEVPLGRLHMLHAEIHTLGGTVSSHAHLLTRNELDPLDACLEALMSEVLQAMSLMTGDVEVHVAAQKLLSLLQKDIDDPSISDTIQALGILSIAPNSGERHFATDLHKVIVYLRTTRADSSESIFRAADAWITFACTCLHLYIPNVLFDPALESKLALKTYQQHHGYLSSRLETLSRFRKEVFGTASNLRGRMLEDDMRELGPAPPATETYRPETSRLSGLQVELDALMRSILPLSQSQNHSEDQQSFKSTLWSNLVKVRKRLACQYREYDDITLPIVGFVDCLLTAQRLFAQAYKFEPQWCQVAHFASLIPFVGAEFSNWMTDKLFVSASSRTSTTREYLLWLGAIALRSTIRPLTNCSTELRLLVQDYFDKFFQQWRIHVEEEQRKAIAKSSLYKFKGDSDSYEPSQEEVDDYFPIVHNDKSGLAVSAKRPQDAAHLIQDLHLAVFIPRSFDETTIAGLISQLMKSDVLPPSRLHEEILPALIRSLRDLHSASSKQKVNHERYDMYRSENVPEANKLLKILDDILNHFKSLHTTFPDHATPVDVIRICDEIHRTAHSTPLAQFLPKVERLHATVNEWQKITSKEYSASEIFERLTTLIIGWRQLELSTWASLFDREWRQCQKDAASWWYIGYETIIAATYGVRFSSQKLKHHASELVKTLGEFIAASGLGEFHARLQMLRGFDAQLGIAKGDVHDLDLIRQPLSNFIRYFEHFESGVERALSEGRNILEREVKNIIQLASWKDRNIDVLRQSARASHHKLLRLVRKYRRLLAQPVEPIVRGEFPGMLRNALVEQTASMPEQDIPIPIVVEAPDIDVWIQRADRFRNVSDTAKLIYTKIHDAQVKHDGSHQLHIFLTQVLESITELQRATPSTKTEENEGFVNHLKARKRRLLADVLREMRHMGFQSSVSQQTLDQQASNALIFSRIPKIADEATNHVTEAGRYGLYRFMSVMPAVRESSRKHSDDITPAEAARCMSLLESLFQTSISHFSSFATLAGSFGKVQDSIDQFNNFASVGDRTVKEWCDGNDIQARATALTTIVGFGLSTLHAQQQLSQNDCSSLVGVFEKSSAELTALRNDALGTIQLPPGIQTIEATNMKNRLKALSRDLRAGSQHAVARHPEVQPIITQIERWLVVDDQSELQSSATESFKISVSEWIGDLLATIDSMLGSVQDVEQLLTLEIIDAENKSWLLKQQKALEASADALKLQVVTRRLTDVLSKLQRLQVENNITLPSVAMICRTLQPILTAYRQAVRRLLNISGEFCKELSDAGYRLAKSFLHLSTQGFCLPSEKSDKKSNQQSSMESGTGLGDGEGSEDISRDIKDDEDLSELARYSQKAENEANDFEDEEDAVDMADEDMQGEAKEAAADSETADDNKSEEADSSEPEEEPGDVNDVGPSAVDEKMWDGAKDHDQRDKESNTAKADTAENDLAAAQENGHKSLENTRDLDQANENEVEDESEQIQENLPEALDPHTQQEDNLELPENISMEGNKPSQSDEPDVELSEDDEDHADSDEALSDKTMNENKDVDFESDGDDDSEMEIDENHTAQTSEDLAENQSTDEKSDIVMHEDQGESVQEANANLAAAGIGSGPDGGENGQGTLDKPVGDNGFEEERSTEDSAQTETGIDDGRTPGEGTTGNPHNAAKEPNSLFKKVGDVLQQWYDQHRPIQEARERDDSHLSKSQNGAMDDVQFEHLPGEDFEGDTQALGAASAEQSTALNDDNAVQLNDSAGREEDVPETFSQEQAHDYHDREMIQSEQSKQENLNLSASANQPTSFIGKPVNEDGAMTNTNDYSTTTPEEMENVEFVSARDHLQEDAEEHLSLSDARQLWERLEDSTRNLAIILTEHLRLILQPTKATKLRGDYRTGKRLNIKRVIPYIASSYKRDKIWMRRSVPSKRSYQVMLAIDDSKSMKESQSRDLAFETLALVARSLSMLEVGELGVVGFGEDVKIAHDFNTSFSADVGAETLKQFTFSQNKTDVRKLLAASLEMFRGARLKAPTSSSDLWQLQLVISDGICEDHPSIRQLVRQAFAERIMVVFIVVDQMANDSSSIKESQQSILDLQTAEFVKDESGEMQLKMVKYLDTFPFGYYLIVRNVEELPTVLAGALRQWFAEVVDADG